MEKCGGGVCYSGTTNYLILTSLPLPPEALPRGHFRTTWKLDESYSCISKGSLSSNQVYQLTEILPQSFADRTRPSAVISILSTMSFCNLVTEWRQKEGATLENLSVADRHQWAINQGREHEASPQQRALLVYIAFRVGPENEGAWQTRDTIKRDTGMHPNTITRALAWWVDRGVLLRTRRQHGSTIYQIQENLTGAIESKNTPEVFSIEPLECSIEPLECSNSTSEVPLKEHKENGKEQEKENTHSVSHDLRKCLEALPEPKREEAIVEVLEKRPTWAQSWPDGLNDAVPYYLGEWDKFMVDIVARVAQEEKEADIRLVA